MAPLKPQKNKMKNLVSNSLLLCHMCICSLAAVVVIVYNVANTIFVIFNGWSDFLVHTPGGDAAFLIMCLVSVTLGAVAVGSCAALIRKSKSNQHIK